MSDQDKAAQPTAADQPQNQPIDSIPDAAPEAAPPATNLPYNWSYPYPYTPVPHKRKEQDVILEQTATPRAFVATALCWVFGLLFSALFLRGGFGLSVPLLSTLFYALAFGYLSKKGHKPTKGAAILLAAVILLTWGYFLSDNGTVYFINTLLLLGLIPLQLSHGSGTANGPMFSLTSFYDTAVSTLARPFGFLDTPFRAVQTMLKQRKNGSKYAMIVLGVVIAFPIAAVFMSLFMQADEAFGYWINRVLDSIDISFDTLLFDLIMGSIVAVFAAAWLITLRARPKPEPRDIALKAPVNGLFAATVLAILNAVQLTFVLVQIRYLFAGATLPDGMGYAQYARSGFFELCGVLCLSVLIIALCIALVQRRERGQLPLGVSLMLTLFIACNYVIVASAVYRMLSYIQAYDLSVKRVMVTWLIAVFALCLIGAVIKIWSPRFRVLPYVAVTVIVMTLAVNTVNVSGRVARYNVQAYLDSVGTARVRDIDVEYLGSLGPSATPATAELYRHANGDLQAQAGNALRQQWQQLEQKTWKSFCLTDCQARKTFDTLPDTLDWEAPVDTYWEEQRAEDRMEDRYDSSEQDTVG